MILIIDENLPPRWSVFLSSFGITATPWRNIGAVGDPDDTIFDYACAHGAIIITQDLDFTRLLALRGTRLPSVIQLRVHCPLPEIMGLALLSVLENLRQQLRQGRLITLDLDRHRIRLLPFN